MLMIEFCYHQVHVYVVLIMVYAKKVVNLVNRVHRII